jgi:hypothetical protein
MITPPLPPPSVQLTPYNNGRNGNDRPTPHHQEFQTTRQPSNQLPMFHYGDHTDESHYHHHSRSPYQPQQRDFDPVINRHQQSKHRLLVSIK